MLLSFFVIITIFILKFISVHLPKTAGSSFRNSLESSFGKELYKDYQGGGLNSPSHKRHQRILSQSLQISRNGLGKIKCVHGHFLPFKYLLLADKEPITFITWMREPVIRLISHYNYWQQAYNPKTSAPHHKQVIEENWTLEAFCLSKRFQNLYSQYLWGFPLEYFAFIGITEHYAEDFKYFSQKFLGNSLNPIFINRSKKTSKTVYIENLDPDFIRKVQHFHNKDMQLYERAIQIRRVRLSKVPSI